MDKNTQGATLLGSATMIAPLPTPFAVDVTDLMVHAGMAPSGTAVAAPPASPDFKPSHCVNAELLLSTPLTVVVRARLDYFDADGLARDQEVALVISRSRCEGDHPYWPALLSAAQEHWHRCPGRARRLSASVDGGWQTLLAAQIRH